MRVLLPIILMFCFTTTQGQSVALSTGVGFDLNQPPLPVAFIPVKAEWRPFTSPLVSFFVGYNAGVTRSVKVHAYTLNPVLPGMVTLDEETHKDVLSIGFSMNINIATTPSGNKFELNVTPAGLYKQSFKVSYPGFDNINYEILDQYVNKNISEYVLGFGIHYRFNKNMVTGFNLLSPFGAGPLKDHQKRYAIPFHLTFGYELFYNKNKKEK